MKKRLVKIISLIVLGVILSSNVFAANIYYPGGAVVSSDATNILDPNLQLNISTQIGHTFSALECKNILQDVNSLGTIRLGSYAYLGYGYMNDPLEWIILERNNSYAILLSKNVLGISEYNDENEDIAYAGTKISKWVDKFYLHAFSSSEKALISNITIPSKNEIDRYFTYMDGTQKLGLAYYENQLCDYWLRNEMVSPTGYYFSVYANSYTGQLNEKFGVRPMIIVNLTN